MCSYVSQESARWSLVKKYIEQSFVTFDGCKPSHNVIYVTRLTLIHRDRYTRCYWFFNKLRRFIGSDFFGYFLFGDIAVCFLCHKARSAKLMWLNSTSLILYATNTHTHIYLAGWISWMLWVKYIIIAPRDSAS
jgi:hypothetical protein